MPEASTPGIMVLPLDIFYHIAEMLEGDSFTLRRLALTSRTFLPCARSSLYKSITVPRMAFWRLDLLSRTLQANPQLGALVKSLKMARLLLRADIHRQTREVWSLTSDFLPFYLLRNLHTLDLQWVSLTRGTDDLIAIMGFLPSLKRLICDYLVQYRQELMRRLPHPLPASPAPLETLRFPVLHELVVTDGPWSHWAFARRLLLNHRGSVAQLESITILLRHPTEALWWVPVISEARRLRSVSISVTDTSVRLRDTFRDPNVMPVIGTYPNDHAYVFDNLSRCTALRTLHLKYTPDTIVSTQSDGMIAELCEALERRRPPWPSLECLRLSFFDQQDDVVSVSDRLCARLASALADKTRLPRFRMLVLRIRPQFWQPHVGAPSPSSPSNQPDRTAIVERWRRAFEAFERVPGVVLDVAMLESSGWQDS